MQKFDDWYRQRPVREGCLLAIVSSEVREMFPKPRMDATLSGKSFGIVLPRGVVAEALDRWATVFEKATNDPDFKREIEQSGLQAELVR